MATTTPLEKQAKVTTWRTLLRIALKAAALFLLFNLAFAAARPLEALGQLSLYNGLLPGRQRLPYGENSAESYNLSLFNVPAMLKSHIISQPKSPGEYRVVLIGDSGTWGWFLHNDQTLAGQINAQGLRTAGGRRVVVYNLGYPIMSLTKDLLLLDEVEAYQPDLIVWPVTLESFPRQKQLVPPLLQHNPSRVRRLIAAHGLGLNPNDRRLVDPGLAGQTIVGQRRELADLLRLQLYGFSWAATGVDQAIPASIPLSKNDLEASDRYQDWTTAAPFSEQDLAFEVLAVGVRQAGARNVPMIVVNEPIQIATGQNSDVRYNVLYPRWAYDRYRQMLGAQAAAQGWIYLDLWNAIGLQDFGDTPVHLLPGGVSQLAGKLGPAILQVAAGQKP